MNLSHVRELVGWWGLKEVGQELLHEEMTLALCKSGFLSDSLRRLFRISRVNLFSWSLGPSL